MPPEVVGELLRAAVYFPASQGLEGVVVHDEDATGAVAVGRANSAYVDAVGSAVEGVGTAVARTLVQFVRFYGLDDLGLSGVGLGVDDVDVGGL